MVDLSIVIPIYNVEKYLNECLDSVVNQKLDNYEVLLINDGSTDRSEKIIDEYVKKYKFIKKINKTNNGLSAARNTGIELAKGKYIAFVDSDDYIEHNMMSRMLNMAKDNEADIVICDIEMFEDGTNKVLGRIETYNDESDNKIITNVDAVKMYLMQKITGHAWNKIYKRKLFVDNEIRYNVGKYYEDMYPTLRLLDTSKKIILIKGAYYKYRQSPNNITSCSSEKHIQDYVDSILSCIEYIKNIHSDKEYNNYLETFRLHNTQIALCLYCRSKKYNNKKIKEDYYKYFAKLKVDMSFKDIILNKNIKRSTKKGLVLWRLGLLPYKEKLKVKLNKR